MRVYYDSGLYLDFPKATHWELIGDNFVELSDDDGVVYGVLNWSKVKLMYPMDQVH